ncbi:hypothetical protein [Jiella sonneratiae]|uniref:Uncharacterized protein n=1 Tax=Jiella sonneratiae TaxID=2816856 RepID=A0ABS3J0F5_9HYPH|nr:hypothetical protein [Jiella sonneratiae]MBO0903152.1 hypothetical protein [Jiella sonneratiae]
MRRGKTPTDLERIAAMVRRLFYTETAQTLAVTAMLFAAVAATAGFLHLVG